MRILVISQYYYPDNFLINDITRQMVQMGNQVTVVTGQPNYSTGEIPEEYHRTDKLDEIINGVHVYRCKVHPRQTGSANRMRNYLSFAINSNRLVNTLKPDFDLIFCYQPSPVSVSDAGVRYGKKHKIPVIIYCLDIWPECLKAWGVKESNPVFQLTKRYSGKIYRSADKLVVSSKPFLSYMKRIHEVEEAKLAYLPQYSPDQYVAIADRPFDNGVTDFLFAGAIGAVQMVDKIVEAAKLMSAGQVVTPWRIHILGDGSEFHTIQKLVKENNLEEQVILYGSKPQEELTEFYKQADVFLLTLQRDNEIGDTLPAKMQGYLCAGRPVIGMAGKAVEEVIRDAKCGSSVPQKDVEKFAATMLEYIQNKHNIASEGQAGRRYYEEHFTPKRFFERLNEQIQTLVQGRSLYD